MPSSPKSKKSSNKSPQKSPKGSKSKGSKTSPKKTGKNQIPEEPEDEEIIAPVAEGVMNRRQQFLLQSGIETDVDFLLGPDHAVTTIKAHKCMLSADSQIFQKLFSECEDWKIDLLKKREEEAQLNIQHDIEMEELLKQPEQQRIKSPDEKAISGNKVSPKGNKMTSPGKGKGKSKGSPGKKRSPTNASSNKSVGSNKSPGKGSKQSPGKSSKSPLKKSNKSPGKSSKKSPGKNPKSKTGFAEAAVEQPSITITFTQDYIVGEDCIRVCDIHPVGFYRLLWYIYYDELVFTGVVAAIRTLWSSRKYGFYELSRSCVNYLENNVCIEHVFKILQASLDFKEERLKNLCMRLLINDTFEAIKREEFKDVSKDIVIMLLQQDILNAREIEVFDRIMYWAENYCETLNIAPTSMNQRVALGNINLSLIRFPTILPHEFATHVVEKGVLKTEEIIPILQYFITGQKPNLQYSCTARRRPCLNLDPLDNASVAFSDQTDITFLGHAGNIRRASSFRDILIPISPLGKVPVGLIKQRQRSGSPPGKFNVSDEEFAVIEENIRHLRHLFEERNQFEYTKRHRAIMSSHYR